MHQMKPFTFGALTVEIVVSPPPWYQNCYVVRHRDSGVRVVIDPGGNGPAIVERLDPKSPTHLLLTHGHFDHLGAAREVQRASGAACRAHADEEPIVSGAARLAATWAEERIEGPEPVEYFTGEPVLDLDGIAVRVVHCPGHTPGGVTYVFDGFAITGDTLFNQGVGRTDLPGGDQAQLVASITRLLAGLPDETVLFAGHGPHWTAAEAKRWWAYMAG